MSFRGDDRGALKTMSCAESKSCSANNAPLTPSQPLRCPAGHDMEAKVDRELRRVISGSRLKIACSRCEMRLSAKDAWYTCKACNYHLCLECSEQLQQRTPAAADMCGEPCLADACRVACGDLVLCGPDEWGIHHVVLVCGTMVRDPEAGRILGLPAHLEAFACPTIESSRYLKGKEFRWYAATSIYARDSWSGQVHLVGDRPEGTGAIEKLQKPVPVKFLIHPLRSSNHLAMDRALFGQALQEMAQRSQKWSLRTALNAMASARTALDPGDYPTRADRAKLMDSLEESWESPPICAAVAIGVWQRYLELACAASCPRGDARASAAQHILRWMPLVADRTMPSVLVKVLTRCGWILASSPTGQVSPRAFQASHAESSRRNVRPRCMTSQLDQPLAVCKTI